MNKSYEIAKFFKIPVRVHWSFGLLFFYVLFIGNRHQLENYQMLWLGLFILAMFVCILLHEFGHALMAKHFGVSTKDIILLPIGGLARLNRLPEKPLHEFLVALAGPLVNLGIVFFLCSYFFIVSPKELFNQELKGETDLIGDYLFFIPALIFLNVLLAVFNLLPAFPMDGGRILRALLSTKFGRRKATHIASLLGQFFAIALFIYGLWEFSFTTILIGLFIFFTARQENQAVRIDSILSEILVKEVCNSQFISLRKTDSVLLAYEFLSKNAGRNIIVVDENGQIAGILPSWAVMKSEENILDRKVEEVFIKDTQTIDSITTLKEANTELRHSNSGILPVMENGELIGTIDGQSIEKVLSLNKVQKEIKTKSNSD